MKMSPAPPLSADRLPWHYRLILVAVALVSLGLLITAATLEPDSRGFGTHQQMGLPPCTFMQVFGMRCPSCGMTTSWTLMLHGNVIASVRANAGGALLAVLAVIGGPWSLACGLGGRWYGIEPTEGAVLIVTLAVLVVTVMDWWVRWIW